MSDAAGAAARRAATSGEAASTDPTAGLAVTPITGLPEIHPGDDLAALIAARAALHDGDVVCVAHKVVSKAEGALVPLPPGEDVAAARRRVARAQARRIVADTPWVLITETPQGLVCANGGLDASNAPAGHLVALPDDPDASARSLRAGLAQHLGADVAVLITDTFGRPWRLGLTDVAIGCAGLHPLHDQRGTRDRGGQALSVTEVATADALAGVAEVVRHKAAGVPVVRVRGVPDAGGGDGPGAVALQRAATRDLFPRGRGMLAHALAAPPSALTGAPVPPDDLAQALRVAQVLGAQPIVLTGEDLAADDAPTRVLVPPATEVGQAPPAGRPADDAGDPTAAAPPGEQAAAAAGLCVAALVDQGHQARLAGHVRTAAGTGWLVEAAAGR